MPLEYEIRVAVHGVDVRIGDVEILCIGIWLELVELREALV